MKFLPAMLIFLMPTLLCADGLADLRATLLKLKGDQPLRLGAQTLVGHAMGIVPA